MKNDPKNNKQEDREREKEIKYLSINLCTNYKMKECSRCYKKRVEGITEYIKQTIR